MAPGGVPGGARLLCLGALVLVWAVPVDPQWRVFRAASSVLAPSYSRDITVPVGELRYPGASRKAPRSSPASGQEQQQPPRSRRQYKSSNSYSKQSTFSLLRRLISETANETRTAFNQIGDILGSQFSDSQSRTTTARTTTTSTTTSSSLSSDAARINVLLNAVHHDDHDGGPVPDLPARAVRHPAAELHRHRAPLPEGVRLGNAGLESEPEPLQAGVPHGRGPIPAGGHDGGLQHHRGVEAAAVSALRARPRASSSHLHVRGPHLGRAEELQREQLGAVRRRIRQRGRRRQRRRRPHASLHRENCCFAALIESSSHFRVDSGKMYYADRSPAWPEQFARFCSAVGFYRDLSAAQSIFMIKTPCYAVETSVPFSAACYEHSYVSREA